MKTILWTLAFTLLLNNVLASTGKFSVHFETKVNTNIPGISFTVQNTPPSHIQIAFGEKVKNQVSINFDIQKMVTGMDLRDTHMREQVFKNKSIRTIL